MILAPAAAIVIGLGILAATVTWLLLTRAWLWSKRGRRVIVHTTGDQSVDGLLAHVGRDGVVLVGARFLENDGGNVPMGGEVHIPRDKVALVQHVP